ncbi:Crp/Fnr family transcriptional regulator [Neptuniibacter halophilus]|uniref:Crp/Fnr family transcriptional regulator n=1 Tax=Neptuniibacter halophilus TaxID=651666 RepID=UPI0025746C7F|nr:cyclic nucleotide-binding domain-containing protein [Neptuniibacter halophilus]
MQCITVAELPAEITPAYLAQGSLFGALDLDCVSFLLQQGEILQLKTGEKLFDVGQRGDAFFIVLTGQLAFYKQHQSELLHTRDIGFGEEIGFVSMIALHDHVGYACASEPSLILKISCNLFADLQQQHPEAFGILLLNLARDMARTIRKLSNALVEIECEARE